MEKFWLEASDGSKSLHSTWANLQHVASSLQHWSKESFGSVCGEIKKLEGNLKRIRLQPFDPATIRSTQEIEHRLCELFEREEIMARQRSRVDWLRKGDRNTAFFHACASARCRTNKIRALVHEDGTRCEELPEIKGMTEQFYGDRF